MRRDEILGEFQYEYMWQRKDKLYIFGKEFDIILFVEGKEESEFTAVQRQAYSQFLLNKEALTLQMEQAIYEYYQSVNGEYRGMYEEESDVYAPIISDKSQLRGLIKPQSITLIDSSDDREINVLFKTKWDLEHGVGIKLINEKIHIVGVQEDVL